MIKEFLKPTTVKLWVFLGAFVLTGLTIQHDFPAGKIDFPFLNSLLVLELLSVFNYGVGLIPLSGHLFLSYLMGCSVAFLLHETAASNTKVAIAVVGTVLSATLIVALFSAWTALYELWDRQVRAGFIAAEVLSRAPGGKLRLGPIRVDRVDRPEFTERIKASLRDAELELTDDAESEYSLWVDTGSSELKGRSLCGDLIPLRYQLIRQGVPIAELKVIGKTGGGQPDLCGSHVFAEMSRFLATQFVGFSSVTGRKLDLCMAEWEKRGGVGLLPLCASWEDWADLLPR